MRTAFGTTTFEQFERVAAAQAGRARVSAVLIEPDDFERATLEQLGRVVELDVEDVIR